jgi:hypothetical protein
MLLSHDWQTILWDHGSVITPLHSHKPGGLRFASKRGMAITSHSMHRSQKEKDTSDITEGPGR